MCAECGREGRPYALGLCRGCYVRAWRARRAAYGPWCAIPGCTQPLQARGVCASHYDHVRPVAASRCQVPGCPDRMRVRSLGLCNRHYRQHRVRQHCPRCRTLPLGERCASCRGQMRRRSREARTRQPRICIEAGCRRRPKARGLCNMHLLRLYRQEQLKERAR